MEPELVSVIIPAYNAASFLGETLHSLSAQSYPRWELIVVEDASQDGTETIVSEFAEKHPGHRVIYHRQEKNRGQGAARNTAAALAQGEYLALLDADDLWTEAHLAGTVASLRQTRCDLVFTNFEVFSYSTQEISESCRFGLDSWGGHFPANLYVHNFIQPSAAVLRADSWKAVGGFSEAEDLRGVEDIDLWMRMAGSGMRFEHLDQATMFYRKHGGAATANSDRMAAAKAHAWFINRDTVAAVAFSTRRRLAATVCERAARHFRRTDPMQSAHFYGMAWRSWPLRLKYPLYAGVFALLALFVRPRDSAGGE